MERGGASGIGNRENPIATAARNLWVGTNGSVGPGEKIRAMAVTGAGQTDATPQNADPSPQDPCSNTTAKRSCCENKRKRGFQEAKKLVEANGGRNGNPWVDLYSQKNKLKKEDYPGAAALGHAKRGCTEGGKKPKKTG